MSPARVPDDPACTSAPTQSVERTRHDSGVVRHDAREVGALVGADVAVDQLAVRVRGRERRVPPDALVLRVFRVRSQVWPHPNAEPLFSGVIAPDRFLYSDWLLGVGWNHHRDG